MTETTEEHWTTSTLRRLLAERQVELLTPTAHRDRWLGRLVDQPHALGLALLSEVPSAGQIGGALDTAAGLLLELPGLEADAWAGWDDPRLTWIFTFLAMAELPEAPPRSMLAESWRELRARVPYTLTRPTPGDAPHPVNDFVRDAAAYLDALGATAGVVAEREEPGEAAPGEPPPVPPKVVATRFLAEVHQHIVVAKARILPLALELAAAAFSGQRSMTLLQAARGETRAQGEGRGLRVRSKQRYHLAAWLLREIGLTQREIWLFWAHVDSSGLATPIPPTDPSTPSEDDKDADATWWMGAKDEVKASVRYWRTGAGARGQTPLAEIGKIEFEVRDLLKPVMAWAGATVDPSGSVGAESPSKAEPGGRTVVLRSRSSPLPRTSEPP